MIGAFLRAELAPSKARIRATIRIAVACVAATFFIMWLHMPNGYWVLITIFVVSQPNAGASLVRGFQRILATSMGALAAILTIVAFSQQPWFELAALGAICGFGLFLSRTSTAPYVGLLSAMTPAILIGLAGDDPTRGVIDGFWRGAAVGLGVAIGTLSQVFVLPEDPEDLLRSDLARTLEAVERELARLASGGPPAPPSPRLRDGAFEGLGRQLDWLGNAEALHRSLRERHGEQLVLIGSVHRLATATLALAELLAGDPSPGALGAADRARIAALLARSARMRAAAEKRAVPHAPPPAVASSEPGFAEAFLGELERALDEMEAASGFLGIPAGGGALQPVPPSPLDQGDGPFFLTPGFSFSNGPAVRYALKGGIAAALSFLVVEALHWPGIGTAVVTSVIVAQSSFGAMVQKATLRLVGAAVGGLLGIATVVFAIPQMDTIASLLVATAFSCGLAGWVIAGSPRISYAGVQMGLAWVLTVLVGLGPTIDLAAPRDRVIGIVVGIGIALFIFRALWPELASVGMRSALVSALRHLGDLSRVALAEDSKGALGRPTGGFRWQVTHDFLDAMRLAAESRLEPQSRSDVSRAAQESLLRVLDSSQSTFLSLLAVVRRRLNAGTFPEASKAHGALLALADDVPPFLDAIADRIETGRDAALPTLDASLGRLREISRGETPAGPVPEPELSELRVRLALYETLVLKLHRLDARSREFTAILQA